MITYGRIILAILTLARSLVQWAEREKSLAEGDRRAIARMTRAIEAEADIAREVEAETAGMTPEQIIRDLDGRGELRD